MNLFDVGNCITYEHRIGKLMDQIDELQETNAELLAALELIARIDITDGDMGAIACAAIAKARGE